MITSILKEAGVRLLALFFRRVSCDTIRSNYSMHAQSRSDSYQLRNGITENR